MSMVQLDAIDAKIARARQLVAEQQRRIGDRHRLGDRANSREYLHDLTYWLHNLEACRENLLRQSRLDGAKSAGQRYAQRAPDGRAQNSPTLSLRLSESPRSRSRL